jgi:AmmeMemoRadiSam system protein A
MKSVGQYKLRKSVGILAALMLAAVSCGQPGEASKAPAGPVEVKAESPQKVRLSAVAGLFYPKDPKVLADTIDRLLAAAKTQQLQRVRALVCPHAGYEFSGPTAACGYKLISGGKYDTVIILAPSHYALFRGASVPAAAEYETPLGRVPVSDKVRQLAKCPGFVVEPRCLVQRPQWAGMASKPEGAPGADTPDTWEHSVEVEVPFLQRTLKDFKILPVIFGEVDPEQVAEALAPIVDDQTLIIASSDLSHYHPYDEARTLDRQTVGWISDMDVKSLQSDRASESACGRVPVLALLYLAKLKGWQPQVLDYRNSGDTAGDKSRVVGYAAIAFVDAAGPKASPNNTPEPAREFSQSDRKFLLDLARRTLRSSTSDGGLPESPPDSIPAACRAARGCFVTLTKDGQLRGCIGNILPAGPLFQAVEENTRNAALRDFRFRPVTAQEAAKLHIEISVLSVLAPLRFDSPEDLLAKLQPNRDGVLLRIGDASATFLPQVWDQLPDKVEFLNHLAEKAGCPPSAWRTKDVTVSIYHVEAFEESK